jgi:hypothetical protein
MKAFTYERPATVADAARAVRSLVTVLGQPALASSSMPAAEQIWPGVQ